MELKETHDLPGFSFIISSARSAAVANSGGRDAEKQYPCPDNRCGNIIKFHWFNLF